MMESNRRIRPRNEFAPNQGGGNGGGGGSGTSSSSTSTNRKSILETSVTSKSVSLLMETTAVGNKKNNAAEEASNHQHQQQKRPTSDHHHDQQQHPTTVAADTELLLMSTLVGLKDKEAQYLYEKCGDSVSSLQRYYHFLLMDRKEDEEDTKPVAMTDLGSIAEGQKEKQKNMLQAHEQHNLALLQFLSPPSTPNVSSSSFSNLDFHQILQQYHQSYPLLPKDPQQDTSAASDECSTTSYLCESSLKRLQSLIAGYNLGLLTLCQGNDPKTATTLLASYFFSLQPQGIQDSNKIFEYRHPQQHQDGEEEEEYDDDDEKEEQVILNQRIQNVQCQIAFAILDGVMACMTGFVSHVRKQQEYFKISTIVTENTRTIDDGAYASSSSSYYLTTLNLIQRVVTWLEMYIQSMASSEIRTSSTTTASNTTNGNEDEISSTHPSSSSFTTSLYSYSLDSSSELKFRLMCYKSRLWFILGTNTFHTKGNNNNNNDASTTSSSSGKGIMSRYSDFDEVTRSARKELKNAIEIFHHKLESEVKMNSGVGGCDLDTIVENTNNSSSFSTANKSNSVILPPRRSRLSGEEGGGEESLHLQNLSLNEPSSNSNNSSHTVPCDGDQLQSQLDWLSKYRLNKLQSQHQNALYLKAYLEFLKSNMKKSLKLCSEALNGNDREGVDSAAWMESELSTLNGIPKEQDANNSLLFLNPRREATPDMAQRVTNYEAAVFNNNLGLIHQSSGKLHLALHYYARALAELERMEQVQTTMNGVMLGFESNVGIANSLHLTTSQVLINTAICAQQARNFVTGYECMARCVMACQALFYDRPWFWLNMAENCVGIHVELSRTGESVESRLTDELQTLIDKASSMPVNEDASIVLLGSEYDISFVKRYPLTRALFCLNTCIWLTNVSSAGGHDVNEEDKNCVESGRLLLAYVWLELNNPASALKEADAVINASDHGQFKYDRERRLALAQAYANEAAEKLR